jgi:succinate-semialdehyde dehydrogenase/glutarate-semialdehyde dehydrogenase
MRAAAEYLRGNKSRLAQLIHGGDGQTDPQSEAEIEKCVWCCDFYADHAESFLANVPAASAATESYVAFDPLGPVLAIMPWNFPFWQAFRFAAPGLMAGNTGVLKHAANVPGCAVAIEEVFREAGFPEGAFQALLVPSSRVAGIIEDERVRAVTLTGQ